MPTTPSRYGVVISADGLKISGNADLRLLPLSLRLYSASVSSSLALSVILAERALSPFPTEAEQFQDHLVLESSGVSVSCCIG